jgi:ATP-binding cassette subfamily B protein
MFENMEDKPFLRRKLILSNSGYSNLKGACLACTLNSFSMTIPSAVSIALILEVIKPLGGDEISWPTMWLLLAIGIVGCAIVYAANRYEYQKTSIASYRESENLRLGLAEHIRKLPMSLFNSKTLTDLTSSLMDDIHVTEHMLGKLYPQLIASSITALVIFISMLFFDWRIALASFSTMPIALLIMIIGLKLNDKAGGKLYAAKLNVSEQAQEYIEGLKMIKAFRLDGEKSKSLEQALRTLLNNSIRFEAVTGTMLSVAQVILQAGIGISVLVGTLLLARGEVGLAPVLLGLLFLTRIYWPILTALSMLPEALMHRAALGRMKALVEIKPMEGMDDIPLKDYIVRFENVSFSYNDNSSEAIHNLTTEFPANGITALVGPSGSGKSTLSKLTARFWDVSSGKVTIDGVDVKKLDPEYLMGYMSFVFQDVLLFNDTVYNNILIGNINATREQVLAAAKAACCDKFIDIMPDGYETVLGENGSTLSGGERQRLSIARALLKDAPVVLLDEATASLDPENEVEIQTAINALIKGKTVIVIAHRLRTVTAANKIIVLENGSLAEEGTHEELIQNKGLYARLFFTQQKSAGWSLKNMEAKNA